MLMKNMLYNVEEPIQIIIIQNNMYAVEEPIQIIIIQNNYHIQLIQLNMTISALNSSVVV